MKGRRGLINFNGRQKVRGRFEENDQEVFRVWILLGDPSGSFYQGRV